MAQTLSSNSGVWREMKIPSLPTQSHLRVFFFQFTFLCTVHTIWMPGTDYQPWGLLRPLFSVPRVLEYQGAIIFISRIGRNVQARVLPFERAFLPTRVTAPAFLTEFAIEWTPRVGRTLVKLPTLPLSCKCRLLIHGETYLEVQWNPVNT